VSGKYIITQCDDAVAALKAAGYKRSEFSVRVAKTSKTVDGQRFTTYGDPVVTIWSSKAKQFEMINQVIAAGFNVSLFVDQHGKASYPAYHYAYGKQTCITFFQFGKPLSQSKTWTGQFEI
jgi:hypothetical protein